MTQNKPTEGKGIKDKKEKHYCPCCGEPSNKYGGGCKNGCYNFCSDIDFHNGEPCDGSC